MKRTVSMVMLAALSLTACGDSESSESGSQLTKASTQTVPVEAAAAPSVPATERSTATTAPSEVSATTGAVGTRSNPVPLGQPAEVGAGWTVLVNSVDLDANDEVAAANQFNEPPAEGKVYVLANVTITYNGSEPSDAAGVTFEALGAATNTAISQAMAVAPDELSMFTEVFQGGSLSGNVVFEVPVADVETLVLIGHAMMSFDTNDRAFFATR